jgi:O-antigen ligase
MTQLEKLPLNLTRLLVFLAPASVLAVNYVMQLCLALLLGLALVKWVKVRAHPLTLEERLLAWSLVLYPASVLLGFVWSGQFAWPELDAPSHFMLAAPILFFLIREQAPSFVEYRWGCALGSIAAAAWALWTINLPNAAHFNRATNGFTNPIPFACIALILAFSALPDRSRKKGVERAALWLAMLAGAWAAVASESRAVLLVLPLASVLYFFSYRQKGTVQSAHMVWASIGAVVLAGSVAFVLKDRIRVTIHDLSSHSSAAADSSIGIRLQVWNASARVFLEHPWLGVGRGNLPLEFKKMADAQQITQPAAEFKHSHNEMLFLLAETGVAGAFAVLAVYVGFLVAFCKRFGAADPRIRSAAFAGIVTVSSYILFGLTDCMLTISMQTAFFALSVVLIYANIRQLERTASPAHG